MAYTDDFTGTAGSLGGNWTETISGIQKSGGNAFGVNEATYQFAYYSAGTFDGNHYSQVKKAGTQFNQMGPTVRCQAGGDLYLCIIYWTADDVYSFYLYKYISGSFTQIGSTLTGNAFVTGDVVRLEADGSTLRIKLNGVQVGSDFSDGTLTGGKAGVMSRGTTDFIDAWEGGDVTAGGVASKQGNQGVGRGMRRGMSRHTIRG